MRALLFQPLQLTLVLALLPSCRTRMNDEVIRRVHDAQVSLTGGLVIEADRWGLVIVLQDISVVLHLVNEREFHPVAFKLDGHAHFSAGIAAAHILAPASDTSSWSGRPNLRTMSSCASCENPTRRHHRRNSPSLSIAGTLRGLDPDFSSGANAVRSSAPERTFGRLRPSTRGLAGHSGWRAPVQERVHPARKSKNAFSLCGHTVHSWSGLRPIRRAGSVRGCRGSCAEIVIPSQRAKARKPYPETTSSPALVYHGEPCVQVHYGTHTLQRQYV